MLNLHWTQVAFVVTTSDSYQQISLWVKYHQSLGVSIFYLFVNGQAAQPEVCLCFGEA